MRRAATLSVSLTAILLIVPETLPCSGRIMEHGKRRQNPTLFSPSRQYCVEQHEGSSSIGGCRNPNAAEEWNRAFDERKEKGGHPTIEELLDDDEEYEAEKRGGEEPSERRGFPTIIFHREASGEYTPIWEIETEASPAVLDDSGTLVLAPRELCYGPGAETAVTVIDRDGTVLATMTPGDFVHPDDLSRFHELGNFEWALVRDEESGHRLLVAGFSHRRCSRYEPIQVAFDVDAREFVTEPAPLFAPFIVGIVPARLPRVTPSTNDKACHADVEKTSVRISSKALLHRVTSSVAPTYPEVVRKARVSGRVEFEVLVAADGTVSCTRCMKSLPFGAETEAARALSLWKFEPYLVDGVAVPFVGALAFEFNGGFANETECNATAPSGE